MAQETKFEKKTFRKGDILVAEGRKDDFVYLIIKGKVEVRLGNYGDNPLVLGVAGPGEIIGEMALFDDHPHMATAIAIEDTTVSAMSRDEFQKRIDEMDPVLNAAVVLIVKRARHMAGLLIEGRKEGSW